jgi:hypothetical protein
LGGCVQDVVIAHGATLGLHQQLAQQITISHEIVVTVRRQLLAALLNDLHDDVADDGMHTGLGQGQGKG